MRCQQKMTNYPEFRCSGTATFRVRWVDKAKSLDYTDTCGHHLSRACRKGFDNVHTDYYSVQVIDLREGS